MGTLSLSFTLLICSLRRRHVQQHLRDWGHPTFIFATPLYFQYCVMYLDQFKNVNPTLVYQQPHRTCDHTQHIYRFVVQIPTRAVPADPEAAFVVLDCLNQHSTLLYTAELLTVPSETHTIWIDYYYYDYYYSSLVRSIVSTSFFWDVLLILL